MPNRIEACFFVEEPPSVEYRNGMFHVVQQIGNYRFERCMRPSTFMQTIARFAEAAREHRLNGAEVIEVDFESKFEKVFKKNSGNTAAAIAAVFLGALGLETLSA